MLVRDPAERATVIDLLADDWLTQNGEELIDLYKNNESVSSDSVSLDSDVEDSSSSSVSEDIDEIMDSLRPEKATKSRPVKPYMKLPFGLNRRGRDFDVIEELHEFEDPLPRKTTGDFADIH